MTKGAPSASAPIPAPRSGRPAVWRRRPRLFRVDRWTLGSLLLAALVALPLVAVLVISVGADARSFSIISTSLPLYVRTSLLLLAGVGGGTLVIGVGTAWLVTAYRFPGRGVMTWALLLPLAVPAYISGYVYTDILEYAGPVQGALRDLFGWQSPRDYWFPAIRSLGGAMLVMSLVLYPYVYLMARSAFLQQNTTLSEAARTLGSGPGQVFRRVTMPMARPAVAVGLAIVGMETLNDLGTVDYFGVQTLSAGLYNVWLVLNDPNGAAAIGVVLATMAVLLMTLERLARRRRSHHAMAGRNRPPRAVRLRGRRGWLALAACALPVGLGFAVPALVLARHAWVRSAESWSAGFAEAAATSLGLSLAAAVLAVAVGLFLAYALRLGAGPLRRGAVRFAAVGYAVPGAVLALGVLIPFAAFDNAVDGVMRSWFGVSTGLLLSGTAAALLFAYVVRFLALAFGAAESGLGRISPSLDRAARTLGHGPGGVLRAVHLPLLRGSLLTGGLLVFVDAMKELPATLLLRPFGLDTLATWVYQLASDERLEEAALGALLIVVSGLVPVILLTLGIARSGGEGE